MLGAASSSELELLGADVPALGAGGIPGMVDVPGAAGMPGMVVAPGEAGADVDGAVEVAGAAPPATGIILLPSMTNTTIMTKPTASTMMLTTSNCAPDFFIGSPP